MACPFCGLNWMPSRGHTCINRGQESSVHIPPQSPLDIGRLRELYDNRDVNPVTWWNALHHAVPALLDAYEQQERLEEEQNRLRGDYCDMVKQRDDADAAIIEYQQTEARLVAALEKVSLKTYIGYIPAALRKEIDSLLKEIKP